MNDPDRTRVKYKEKEKPGQELRFKRGHDSKKRVDLGVRGLTETLSSATSQLWRSVFGVTYHAVYKK